MRNMLEHSSVGELLAVLFFFILIFLFFCYKQLIHLPYHNNYILVTTAIKPHIELSTDNFEVLDFNGIYCSLLYRLQRPTVKHIATQQP